jgi:hypothetical protein
MSGAIICLYLFHELVVDGPAKSSKNKSTWQNTVTRAGLKPPSTPMGAVV